MITREVNIGKAISQRINELGITQTEFARRVGISKQYVSAILRKQSVDTEDLQKYGEALGCNFFVLFCKDEIDKPKETSLVKVVNSPILNKDDSKSKDEEIADLKSQLKMCVSTICTLATKLSQAEGA
jgi:transcriptional regulator with XRE-family HTH domain